MKRILAILCVLALLLSMTACHTAEEENTQETRRFTDSCGRTVEIPTEISRVAPSGSTAQMILMTVAPEKLVGLSSETEEARQAYFPAELNGLPVFGQFYGSKANLNMEALIAAAPQIIIDLGDAKDGIAEDMDTIQQQTGIPTVFVEASLDKLSEAYRTLGMLLGKEAEAEQLAAFIDRTLRMAEEKSILVTERKTVYYGTGQTGLTCNAAGSPQADVIERIGAENGIVPEKKSNRYGGTEVDPEQLYTLQPDVILLSKGGPYETLRDGEWSELAAVKEGAYYEVPNLPYDWLSNPPSVNRVLGIWWLGNQLYPEIYDYDIVETAQEFYRLFWHYELSREEAEEMLVHATVK